MVKVGVDMEKKEFTCSAVSAGIGVNFFSNVDIYPQFAKDEFLIEHVDLRVSRELIETPFSVYYEDGVEAKISYNDKIVRLVSPWDKTSGGHALMFAAYPLIEFQRQEKNCLTAYSAAVALVGRGILLFGKIGAGKTTISLDLCRKHGASLIGNDLSVIGLEDDQLYLAGGTKFFFLRYESIKRSLPELLPFFPDEPEETWLYKRKVMPADLGIKIRSSKTPVEKIYIVHVDESSPSLFVKKDDSLATALFLNENFSRYIRATCIVAFGGEKLRSIGYVPSYDKADFYEFRKKLLETVMESIRYVSGSLREVSDYIANDD